MLRNNVAAPALPVTQHKVEVVTRAAAGCLVAKEAIGILEKSATMF